MSEFPYMTLFPANYFADTMHLDDPALHGCYLLLLMNMWLRPSCSLPDDPKELAVLCRMTKTKFKKIWPSIEPFFEKKDGKITQKRLTKERKLAQQKKETASKNAQKRWDKAAETNDSDDANAYATDTNASRCGTDASIPIPIPIPNKEPPIAPKGEDLDLFKAPKPKRRQKSKQEAHPDFESFKEAYPSRIGAQGWSEASRNFLNIVNAGSDPEILIKAAQTYARSTSGKTGEDRQFVMQAASFLGPKKQAWREFMNGQANGAARPVQVSPDQWAIRVTNFKQDNTKWARDWGPKPGEAGCAVPPEMLEQFNEQRRET